MRKSMMAIAAILGVVFLLATAPAAQAGGDKFKCKGESADGIRSMDAEIEFRDGRVKFSATIEGQDDAGASYDLSVKGDFVETITVAVVDVESNGDVNTAGEVNYDTNDEERENDTPFPMTFPKIGVGAGTEVKIGDAACTLQD